MLKILVVEDEAKLRRTLVNGLRECGYEVSSAADGELGLKLALENEFDCLVVDMMLPGCDGLDIVQAVRQSGQRTPIVMLTARDSLEDRVLGLDSGADDYLGKPFAWKELLARIRACVRRNDGMQPVVFHFGKLSLDCTKRILSMDDKSIELTLRECEVLEYLIRNQDRDIKREDLARDVWNEPQAGLTNVIDVYVGYLRKKLARLDSKSVIQTIRGIGYRLETK